jgi:hypothetical protein
VANRSKQETVCLLISIWPSSTRINTGNVLQRVVAVVKFLAEQGLALLGDDEILGSRTNGNFQGIVEVISRFDPFLKERLERHGNKEKGKPSSTFYDRLIGLVGKDVLKLAYSYRSGRFHVLFIDS